jgi:hypothetical protein
MTCALASNLKLTTGRKGEREAAAGRDDVKDEGMTNQASKKLDRRAMTDPNEENHCHGGRGRWSIRGWPGVVISEGDWINCTR